MTKHSWKQLSAAVFLGVLLQLLPALALAQIKVGFVNISKVLDKAPQAESARERIEKEFAPRDRELLEQQKEIRAMEDKLVKNGAVMSATERQRQESEIRSLKREIRRLQDEFREDLNLRRSQELSKLQRKVTEVIQALAKAESYDLIVTDGVIYAGERIDITDRIIAQLTTEFRKTN
ncbi:MAG: OmpH family outer membrane protein [Gammaproteobacteria bacterium]|nr:OmpH family outer membrane protein [Gammaproteobacteria bacterium]MDH3413725.1 OmpH family outer membrane protein [Gammaproteobacteria bacterium]